MRFFLAMITLLPSVSWALSCNFRSHQELGRLALAQVQNLNCEPKRVHLTFDDGPHPQNTPLLLRELNLRGVKSTFFVSTTNIAPKHDAQKEIVSTIMDSGHTIGSHGYEHVAHALRNGERLSPEESNRQILLSTRYLDEATGNRFSRQRPLMFRFPYGRGVLPSDDEMEEMERRGEIHFSSPDRAVRLREYRALSGPLHRIAAAGYGHLLWNHDSEDSTTNAPTDDPDSKAAFITKNLSEMCSSSNRDIVALFHDIKPFNPEVVSIVIDLGRCLGINFVDSATILSSPALRSAGTWIPKEQIIAEPVRRIDQIGELLASLNPSCPEEDSPTPGSCFSQDLNRYFRDCESGAESICIRGGWFRKTEEKILQCRSRGL